MLFGLVALRATGLGFLMITLALSQVLWGTAYRWVVGDRRRQRALRAHAAGAVRHQPRRPAAFYYFALVVTIVALWMMARFVGSPFGAALRGTRDQPRRMGALGHDVWLVRWITFVYAGFWGAVVGPAVRLLPQVHPPDVALARRAPPKGCSA